jgi:hypothetical protein
LAGPLHERDRSGASASAIALHWYGCDNETVPATTLFVGATLTPQGKAFRTSP